MKLFSKKELAALTLFSEKEQKAIKTSIELSSYCKNIKSTIVTEETEQKEKVQKVRLSSDAIESKIEAKKYKNEATLNYADNIFYIGETKKEDEIREGIGEYHYESGAIYKGEWENGVRTGLGYCDFPSGNSYSGNWSNGMRNGIGMFSYKNSGDTYEGDFLDDDRNGFGVYRFSNESTYKGFWSNNQRHGKGLMISNEEEYVGDWEKNIKKGIGMISKNEQVIFAGEWKDNIKHGIGFEYDKEDITQCIFVNGKLTQVMNIIPSPMKQKIKKDDKFDDVLIRTI